MKNHQLNHNKTFILILLILSLPGILLSQGLEIEYPRIRGIVPERASPWVFATYIYYFAGSIVAIIAFFSIVISALQYTISGADPGAKIQAKKRIFGAILGILILAFGPIFLRTFRREFLIIPEAQLERITEDPRPFELASYIGWESQTPIFDPLNYLKATAQEMMGEIQKLESEIGRLRALLEGCRCENITSFCNFTGKECVKLICDGEPCPNREEIQKTQIKIKMLLEKILYLGRIFKDFKEKVTPEMLHKQATPSIEARVKALKDLLKKLEEPLEKLEAPIFELNSLVYKCLTQVKEKCDPVCELITNNCFFECEAKKCKPKDESDPYPCPMKEVKEKIEEIGKILWEIRSILNQFRGFEV